MHKWILAFALAIVVVVAATVGITHKSGTALAATAANTDNRGSFICWEATTLCMDLKDDTFSTDQEIYLWSSTGSDMGNGLGWNLHFLGNVTATAPFTSRIFGHRYGGDPYYQFEKTTATGHNGCIGIDTTYHFLSWQPCSAAYTYWVWSSSNFLGNVRLSDENREPYVASVPPTLPIPPGCVACDGSRIFALAVDGPDSGPWNLFTGMGG